MYVSEAFDWDLEGPISRTPFILSKAGSGLDKNWLINGGKPVQVWTKQPATRSKFGHGP